MATIEISWNNNKPFDVNLATLLDRYIAAREGKPDSQKVKSIFHSNTRLQLAYELRAVLKQEPKPLDATPDDLYYEKLTKFEAIREKVRKKRPLFKSQLQGILEYAARQGFHGLVAKSQAQGEQLRRQDKTIQHYVGQAGREEQLHMHVQAVAGELNVARGQRQNLLDAHAQYDKTFKTVDADKQKKDEIIRALDQELKDTQAALKKAEDQIVRLGQAVVHAEGQAEIQVAQAQSPAREKRELQGLKVQLLQGDLAAARDRKKLQEVTALETRVGKLRVGLKEIGKINIQLTREKEQISLDLEQKILEYDQAQQAMFAAQQEAHQLRQRVEGLEAEQGGFRDAIDGMAKQAREHNDKVTDLKQRLARVKVLLKGNIEEKEAALFRDVNQLRRDKQELSQQLQEADARFEPVAAQLRQSDAEQRRLQQELAEQKARFEQLQAEHDIVKRERNTLKVFLASFGKLFGSLFKRYKARHGAEVTKPVELALGVDFDDLPNNNPQAEALRDGSFLANIDAQNNAQDSVQFSPLFAKAPVPATLAFGKQAGGENQPPRVVPRQPVAIPVF